MDRQAPPDSDELEISVIGPGRGECVIVHLGDNEWCIVDSCIARGSQNPVAIDYLRSLNNGALNGVRLIIATHWHDDHIRGISEVLRVCQGARFACSAAVNSTQFATMVKLGERGLTQSSGTQEFSEIFRILLERKAKNIPASHVSPILALENRRLLTIHDTDRSFDVRIDALSPSDGLITLALTDLSRWLPKPGNDQVGIVDRPGNDTSVVLWLELGEWRILLGGDLEYKAHAGEGWLAALAAFSGNPPAGIYKVAHHGSSNADCNEIWQQLLYETPNAIVTPFSSGKKLPQKSDLKRLLARTPKVHLTYDGSYKPLKRERLVEKQIVNVPRSTLAGTPGHVRIRCKTGKEPQVEHFHGARRIVEADTQ